MAGTDEPSGGAVAVRSTRSRSGELRSWIVFGAIAVAAWELRLAVKEEVAFFQKVREGREALREA